MVNMCLTVNTLCHREQRHRVELPRKDRVTTSPLPASVGRDDGPSAHHNSRGQTRAVLRGLLNERRHKHFLNPELGRKNNSKKKSKINEEIREETREIKCTHDTVSVNHHTSVGIN